MNTLLRLFLPFALGYFLSYLFRVISAVVAPALTADLQLDAATLGLISSSYFLTFAACQIPLGVLLDRIEVRKLAAVLLLFAATGSLVFALADSALGLLVGRGLIGIGVSACLMAAFKAYVIWLPAARLPLVNGLQLACGGLGALAATSPVEWLLGITDWRGLFLGMALLCLLASLLLWLLVPKRPGVPAAVSEAVAKLSVIQVMLDPRFYRVAPASVLSQASFIALQSLWVGAWLRDVMGLSDAAAADVLFVCAAGMVAGFLLMGLIADRVQHLGLAPRQLSLGGIAAFVCLLVLLQFDSGTPSLLLWGLLGFFGTSGTLMFAGLAQQFPPSQSGRVSTSLNLGIFVGAFVMQWGLGGIVQLWPASATGQYPAMAYRVAFGVACLVPATGLLWYALCTRRPQPDSPNAAST
ncbi:MFS transporter [Marinobacterium rhizophilum]|uniref:MFS transporter n=1 Tax=Marinobacterium rhizophilum TaxID=420402 RepID=A0ABY5HIR4_9GAMM|nr:MFS transporter [Marinobacterium rhizophilum]UTW11707.1 MFS transporter [Marinobacterium rhizophilum]